MSCPHCGGELEIDPEGGWCEFCGEYFPIDVLEERSLEYE